jgi:hypothetical protein
VRVQTTGDWKVALEKLRRIEKDANRALQRAILAEAQNMRGEMVSGIDGGAPGGKAFAAHAPATPYLRRATGAGKGSKILIASSALRSSIIVLPLPGGGAFVGVHRSAKKGRIRIGQIQEAGATIRVTDRMRRFLHAMLRKAGAPRPPAGKGAAVTIRIPPRPFIGPIVAKYRSNGELQRRITARIARDLGL